MDNLDESIRNNGLADHLSNLANILDLYCHRTALAILNWFVDSETIAAHRFVCLRSPNQLDLLAIYGSTREGCFLPAIDAHSRQLGHILSHGH